ncbi:RHS repeat-associated core domain-containing protein [Malonomonas rubra DSM 5091]|uniref:RHS repeat-associated core domain-containing protein n=1 Tax=Malonomonas rubra DSM 5091 TaxID=1122189 RepID=A0A1M6H938_MALRU|nr:RHS repeat-associated core domain-containing protein [Malonomonas rubra]SHJ18706.1 RHS repeat-associated core domain-containing protein [Malonomonas rubra DSM 5091]
MMFMQGCLRAVALVLLMVFPLQAAEVVTFYHVDPVGTPLVITDASGQKVWEADYKPFGEEYRTQGTQENSRRFVGKERDAETGLDYFGARYMATFSGRFLAVDAVRVVGENSGAVNSVLLNNPQRLNVYSYSLNNPYRFLDPDGNYVESAWDAASLAAGVYSISQWNKSTSFGDMFMDVAGVAVDGLALALPIPGGAGLALKAGRGLGQLSHAGKYGVKSYGELRKAIKGTGLEAHHLIEKRFARVLGTAPGDMASVAVTRAEHQVFTNAWRKAIPYGEGTAAATKDQIMSAATQIYKNHPKLLDAIKKEK